MITVLKLEHHVGRIFIIPNDEDLIAICHNHNTPDTAWHREALISPV